MRIRVSEWTRLFLERLRETDEEKYHSLRGLIILLTTAPMPDDRDKIEMDFGGGARMLVYMGLDWWIAYQNEDDEETLYVVYIHAA